MGSIYRTAGRVFLTNLSALALAAALLLALAILGQTLEVPIGLANLAGLLVHVPLLYLLHRAVLRGEPVARLAGLRDGGSFGRFAGLVTSFQVASWVLAALTMVVVARDPGHPVTSLVPLGLLVVSLLAVSLIGTAAPAAADGRRDPLHVGWTLGSVRPGRIFLGLLLGPALATVAALVASNVLATALGVSRAVVEEGHVSWENLPLGFAYGLATPFAATQGVVVLCRAYRDGIAEPGARP